MNPPQKSKIIANILYNQAIFDEICGHFSYSTLKTADPNIQVKFKVIPRLIYEKNKKKFKKFELQIFIKIRKKIRKK